MLKNISQERSSSQPHSGPKTFSTFVTIKNIKISGPAWIRLEVHLEPQDRQAPDSARRQRSRPAALCTAAVWPVEGQRRGA